MDDTWRDDTCHTRVTLGIMRAKCPTRRRGEEVEDTWLSKAMCAIHEHGIVKAMCQVHVKCMSLHQIERSQELSGKSVRWRKGT